MRIYIVRHGIATPPDVDPQRPLTAKGRLQTEQRCAKILPQLTDIQSIYHSTKLRAKETAQIFARAIGMEATEVEGLSPNDAVKPVADELVAISENVMIVSHLPFIEDFISYLIPTITPPHFEPSSLVILDNRSGTFTIKTSYL